MKYLIVGLGNIGPEYQNTRHNIGFKVLDAFAKASNAVFEDMRYGAVATVKLKGRTLILLKPNTYMNLSGRAVNYWLQQEKIEVANMLVIVDDLALPFGALRMKTKGTDAGHNGLADIANALGHNAYTRIRFGIGSNFSRGKQVEYVLAPFTKDEMAAIPERSDKVIDAIKSFGTIGPERTMNSYNGK